MLRRLLVLLPMLLLSAGCQQAAWKAGASADDFARDRQACAAQSLEDPAAARRCLLDKGWTVAEFGGAVTNEPVAADILATPAAAAAPESLPLNDSVRDLPTPASTPASSGTPTAHAPVDPLQRQSVQSWWKAGGLAADFDRDAGACLEELGDQHLTDYAQHRYTHAMVRCLRERGWYAGVDPVYTPLR